MGKDTKIETHDHSFNPWWGCYKVGDGCDNCYAESFDKRIGGDHWGVDKPIKYMAVDYWKQPQKWDREAKQQGVTKSIICGSQCDVWDNRADPLVRARLFELIKMTPNLLWCLYTSRIGNAKKMLPKDWGNGYPNVMLMTSVSTQKDADRDISTLLKLPARYRGLSLEPLLEEIKLGKLTYDIEDGYSSIDFIVVGGESNSKKPCHTDWIREIVSVCVIELINVFVKQLGSNPVCNMVNGKSELPLLTGKHHGYKWNEPEHWPEELRVREFIDYVPAE